MHKTFAANPSAELTQITFWTAYKDFFAAHSSLLSASEVIKNVTTAFPGALAKVTVLPDGTNRFVIAGLGFRKATGELRPLRWADNRRPGSFRLPLGRLLSTRRANIGQITRRACYDSASQSSSPAM